MTIVCIPSLCSFLDPCNSFVILRLAMGGYLATQGLPKQIVLFLPANLVPQNFGGMLIDDDCQPYDPAEWPSQSAVDLHWISACKEAPFARIRFRHTGELLRSCNEKERSMASPFKHFNGNRVALFLFFLSSKWTALMRTAPFFHTDRLTFKMVWKAI